MREVDARGLSCPEPMMMAEEALQAEGPVKVLVSEAHQRTNIEKLAKNKGRKFTTVEKGTDFEIMIE